MNKFLDHNIEENYLDDYLFTRCMDINYDGNMDILDIVQLINIILQGQ